MIQSLGRHALKDVPQPEHLFQLDVPGLPRDFPPIRTGAVSDGNLPPRLTSFVGREAELDHVATLLRSARLVTISGPGGIGKTSLAVEVARMEKERFAGGAWLVPLEAVMDAVAVPAAIARTLGIQDGPGRPVLEGLTRFFAERQALLVLDNFEQVLDAASDVASLLRSAPDLRILVTSRAALRVGGEQEFPLGPLSGLVEASAPVDTSAAVRLFVDRARAVQPGWDLGTDEAAVEDICRLVDCLPLGIELAAARSTVLPPTAIRDRLMARLPLPGAGPRDVPERQRTLDGTIAWSYELLAPDRQRLLRELSVFDGSFDLEQVPGVATLAPRDDPLDVLLELADQSLISRSTVTGHRTGPGGVRFRMLETIRMFALRQIGDPDEERAIRKRHAHAMLELAETAADYFLGFDQARWLDRLTLDHANLEAALRWAIGAGEVELAQRLSYATWRYWQFGGHLREGRALADAVIEMPRADEPSPGRMWSLAAAAGLAYWQADPRAGTLYRGQLETALQIGDRAGEADANFNLAATDFIGGDRAQSTVYLDRARELYRALGDNVAVARTDWSVASLKMSNGEIMPAIEMLTASKQQYAASGEAMYESLAAGSLAFANQIIGNRTDAFRWAVEAITLSHAIRDVATTTITLAAGAIMLLEFGGTTGAATLMGAFDGLCELHGVKPPAGIGLLIVGAKVEERAYAALESEEYAAAVRRGRAMSLDEAVAYLVSSMDDASSALTEGGFRSETGRLTGEAARNHHFDPSTMSALARIPVHPILFAAYAILFLYAANLDEVLLVDAATPIARSVLTAAAVWVVLALVFRGVGRAAIVTSALVIAFFAFGHLEPVATSYGLDDRAHLSVWLLIVIGAAILAARARMSMPRITTGLNVMAIVLVVLSATTIVPYELARGARDPISPVATVNAATTAGRTPDIYFLVFDRYGSADAIERRFGITDNDLYGWLEDRGFQVPAVSRAAYRATDFSLASTLNMRYLDELTRTIGRVSGDRTPARKLIEQHEVGRFLKDHGYTYYHLGTWFGATASNPLADQNLSLGKTSEFESVLRDTTVLPAIDRLLGVKSIEPTFRDRHREGTLFQFRQLHRLATAPSPKFVFAHILLPHDPYVFRADGSPLPEAEAKAGLEKDLYAAHLAFLNGQIKDIVDDLLAGPDASDPIVIVQADEGPLKCQNVDCVSTRPEYFGIRFGILNAMYLPGVDRRVPDSFTSVNTFRVVLKEYFGADLDLLPNHSYTWPDNNHIYDFQEITDRIPTGGG